MLQKEHALREEYKTISKTIKYIYRAASIFKTC